MSANPRRSNGSLRSRRLRELRAQARPCWVCGLPIDYGRRSPDLLAFECDEIVPVSRGGSPYDPANLAPTHRCCNNWRRAKPVSEVERVRTLALRAFGPWRDPLEFVAMAKAAERSPEARPALAPPRTSTEW